MKRMAVVVALIVAALTLTYAQEAPPAQGTTKTPRITKRQLNQQRRINRGVKSGELTPAETRRLEAEQGKIQADKMKAKSDGNVTPQERRKLRREENKASRDIYRLKHNNRAVPPKQ